MARFIHLQATFAGSAKIENLPFTVGSTYNLIIKQGWFGKIHVLPCHGHEWKPMIDYAHDMPDLLEFLQTWRIQSLEMALHNGFQRIN